MTTQEIVKLLKESNHHILSKNYHDGCGRQYWLRDEDQKDVATLDKKKFEKVAKAISLRTIPVISSDEAYLYEAE